MRILVIPHAPATVLKTRSEELAIELAKLGHEVDVYAVNQPKKLNSFFSKIFFHLQLFFQFKNRVKVEDNLYKIYSSFFMTKNHSLVNLHNRIAGFFLGIENYDVVLNASAGGPLLKKRPGQVFIYDVVDEHEMGDKEFDKGSDAAFIASYLRKYFAQTDIFLTCSSTLKDRIDKRYNIESIFIPNGARTKQIANNAPSCENKHISLGYFGGLDGWVNFDLVAKAMSILEMKGHKVEFHVWGPGERDFSSLHPGIHFHGLISPDKIPTTFKYFNIGLLPFEISEFTDVVLALKLIEYGSAKRMAVATSLKELQHQKLPWVVLSKEDSDSFADAILSAHESKWSQEWDQVIEKFSWKSGAEKIDQILGS